MGDPLADVAEDLLIVCHHRAHHHSRILPAENGLMRQDRTLLEIVCHRLVDAQLYLERGLRKPSMLLIQQVQNRIIGLKICVGFAQGDDLVKGKVFEGA